MLYLNTEFDKYWHGQDPYKVISTIRGTVYRQVRGRKTLQFEMNGNSYFIKIHLGVGWAEIIKNLLQLRLPITSAENEWRAINLLRSLGIDTMTVVAYGKKGLSPASTMSFIVTEDLQNTTSLEDFCASWAKQKPDFLLKKKLIEKIAEVSRTMHTNGLCHRDYYICHFLLHTNKDFNAENPRLSLIDLHRALIKKNLGSRWIEKDIAGLFFSAMDIGLTQRDLYRFMKYYKQRSLRDVLNQDAGFWKKINSKAHSLYKKIHGPQ